MGGSTVRDWYWALNEKWEPYKITGGVLEWAKAFETGSRVLKHTQIGRGRVSTIFLGMDMAFGRNPDRPLVWESMVFDIPNMDRDRDRYGSKAEALAGHDALVKQAVKEWKALHKKAPKIIEENLIIIENPYSPTERVERKDECQTD